MAFFSKVGNILKQTVNKNINYEICGSNSSIFQMIRCMSSSKLFVGGISYGTDDTSLREAFDKYGEVIEARVIMDRDTGRSRGFGFITYSSGEEASAAIQALDGQELHGRMVRVNYATDRAPRAGGFGGGYGGGGGGYDGGGGYGGGSGYGGNNYGSGGGGYGGSSYGSGGGGYGGNNYGSGGGGYGGNNYASGGGGGGSYGGGNVAQGDTYGSGTGSDSYGGGSGHGNGVAGGGSDNFVSGDGADSGVGYGGDGFVNTGKGKMGPEDSIEHDYNDDDDDYPDDFANRKA